MGKIKIYDIAKKLNLTSKEVLDIAKKLKIEAKSHLSGVDEEEAKKIEKEISKKQGKGTAVKEKTEAKKGSKKEEKAPVIIRREVIISEEEPVKKKEPAKKETRKNNVGFVERKQNKDYNIVYRNKPNKPMTVSELFGLKKEEPKKEEPKEVKQEKKEDVKVETKAETKVETKIETKTERETKVETVKTEIKKEINSEQPKEQKIMTNKSEIKQENKSNRVNNNYNNYNNRNNNHNNRDNNYSNRDNRENNYNNRENNYNNRNNNYRNNRNTDNNNKSNNRFDNNRNGGRFGNRNGNNNERYNNRNNNYQGGRKPLDEKGIEKNIKNIMAVETVEKETVREYNRDRVIDKQKNNNKFDENRNKKAKSRRNNNENDFDEGKLKSLKQANRLSNMFEEQDGGMLDYYDLTTERGRRGKKRKTQNQESRNKQKIFKLTEIEIPENITVKDLAAEMKKTTAEVIKKLLGYGIMATINQDIDFDTAYLVAQEFGITAKKKETVTEEDILFDDSVDKEEDLQERPPVIVVMGHVDHGKTSLLDAVRKTNVIEGEAGGITQAIGAYKVKVNGREITFLDTPGHEAFTAMRARGAQITDIAILVVAANDGVKPQTIEAINHAKSAGIPIIVAINKIDLPDANIEKVKQELMAYDLVPEEWGGDTIYVPISAK